MSPGTDRPIDALIERAVRGEATAEELARLAAWRAAAPENERLYRRTERLVAAAMELRPDADAVPPRPAAEDVVARVALTRRRRGPVVHAAARLAPWAVAAAAVLVAALEVARPVRDAGWAPAEVVTGPNELATVKLGDGSVVRLASASRLQVVGGRTREVLLEGRAFFAVAEQDGQPFLVRTSAATAKVLGTRFELATDDGGLRLRVLEGRVALEAPENRVEVGAGEESGVRHGAASHPTPLASADSVLAWLGRFVAFQATPLHEAVREIERLYGVDVVVADSALAEQTITATFTDRPLEDVVGVVCAVLNARCSSEDGVVTIGR